jgi:hypothetical protein
MAKASDYIRAILAGGLPAALDYGPAAGTATGDAGAASGEGVETTAPEPSARDFEPLTAARDALATLTQTQILTGTAVVLGVLGVIYFIRK